jgi:serine phosphatase RsbU (regulator of sigma subunit)
LSSAELPKAEEPIYRDEPRFGASGLLVLGAVVLLLAVSFIDVLHTLGLPTDGWNLTFDVSNNAFRLMLDRYLGESDSPLRQGDLLVTVGGVPHDQIIAGWITASPKPPQEWAVGATVPYEVLRDGSPLGLEVQLRAREPAQLLRALAPHRTIDLIALGTAVIGLFVFLRAPGSLPARLLFVFGAVFLVGIYTSLVADQDVGLAQMFDRPAAAGLMFFTLLYQLTFLPVLTHLSLVFPVVKWPLRRHPAITLTLIYGLTPLLDLLAVVLVRDHPASFWPGWYMAWQLASLVLLLTIAVSLVHSFITVRDPVAKAQLRWIGFGFVITVAGGFLLAVIWQLVLAGAPFFAIFSDLAFLALPLSIGIAIARYRLFDIDTIINRALIYGALTGVLVVVYLAGVIVLQALFRALTAQSSEWAIIGSTLIIAALFAPLRRRLQTLIDRLFYRRRYDAAKTLTAFRAAVRDVVEPGPIAELLLSVVTEAVQPTQVALWRRAQTTPVAANAHQVTGVNPGNETEQLSADLAPGDPLLAHFLGAPGAVHVSRLKLDSPGLGALRAAGVYLVVPLVGQGELIGLLYLGPRRSGQDYRFDDRAFLTDLAALAAPALRVAQLFQERQAELRERDRIEQELRLAEELQRSLLPKRLPELPNWRIDTFYRPARAVGGDFYDFIPLPDGRLGLVVGDVADKGMAAALMMATTRTTIRATVRTATSPAEVLARVNDELCPDMPRRMFVTCFYAVLDPATGRLQFANAGHDPAYLRTAEGVVELAVSGMPLGAVAGAVYPEREAVLAPGDALVLYSDGLVEAHDPSGEMFGFPRLVAALAAPGAGRPLTAELVDRLAGFTGAAWEQEDDVTLVVLDRAPAPVAGAVVTVG